MKLKLIKILWILLPLIKMTVAQLPGLPPGVEIVNPRDLGLSESDLEKFLGKVKVLNGGNRNTQVVSVGFDENEKINLEDFKELPMDGLGGEERLATQRALEGLKSQYSGNIQPQFSGNIQQQFSGNNQQQFSGNIQQILSGNTQQQQKIYSPSPSPPPVITLPVAPPIQQPNTQVEVFNSHSRDITQQEAEQILGDVQQQGPVQFVQESSMVIPHQGGSGTQFQSSTPQPFIFQYQPSPSPSPQPNIVQNQQQYVTATPAPPMQIMISSTPSPQPPMQYQQAPLVQQIYGPIQVAQASPAPSPPSAQPHIIMISSTPQPQTAPAVNYPQPQAQVYMVPQGQQQPQISPQQATVSSGNPEYQQFYVSQPLPQPPVQQYFIQQQQPGVEQQPQYFSMQQQAQPQYFAVQQPQQQFVQQPQQQFVQQHQQQFVQQPEQQFYIYPERMPEVQFQQPEQLQQIEIQQPKVQQQKAVVEEMHTPKQQPQVQHQEDEPEQPEEQPLKVQFSHAYELQSQKQNTQEDDDDEPKFQFPQKQKHYSSSSSPHKTEEFSSYEKNKPPHYVPPHSLFFSGLDDDGIPNAPTIKHGPVKSNFGMSDYVSHNDIEENQVRRPPRPSFSYSSRPRPRTPFSSSTSKYGKPVSNSDLIKFFSTITSSSTPRYYTSSKNYRDRETPFYERTTEPSFRFPSYSNSKYEPRYSDSEVIYPIKPNPHVPIDVTPSTPMVRISEPQNALKSDRWSGGTGRGFRSYNDYDSITSRTSISGYAPGFKSSHYNSNFEPISSGSEHTDSYFRPIMPTSNDVRQNNVYRSSNNNNFEPISSGSEHNDSYFRPILPTPNDVRRNNGYRSTTTNPENENDARIRMYYELIQNKLRNTFRRRFLRI